MNAVADCIFAFETRLYARFGSNFYSLDLDRLRSSDHEYKFARVKLRRIYILTDWHLGDVFQFAGTPLRMQCACPRNR